MHSLYTIIFMISLPFTFAHALTVGVFDIRGDVGTEGARLADLAQTELAKDKALSVRDRLAVENLKKQQEKCAAGLKACPELDLALKTLDVYVTGEAVSLVGKKQIILRAVKMADQKISALGVGNADSLEKSMAAASRDLAGKMAAANKDAGSAQRWKLMVEPVRAANAAAQKLPELAALDSLLLSALAKRAAFDLVETKSDDIAEAERLLVLQGFAPGASAPMGSDYTHYVTATLKVYDEWRTLSYQVVSKKTLTAVITDTIEWSVNEDTAKALDTIAERAESDIIKTLGALEISSCDPKNATLSFEFKNNTRAPEVVDCKAPLVIEGIPAGEYTIVFRHEERNTLTKTITIKPIETLKLGRITLPEIDMTLYQQAGTAEGAGKYAEANILYAEFYKKYPKHRMAAYAMYREGYVTQLKLKQVAQGRKILENVIARKPDAEIRSEAYIGMALGYRAEGDGEKANGIFRMLAEQYAGTTAAEFARECLDGKCSF
ncbi:MAG: hypothetical protein JSR44_06995 [Spirochaetes bacterium]|nr:hypothetical protein [Spirochaetota bacterium]